MIYYHPQGMTVNEWFEEIRRCKHYMGTQRDRKKKREERKIAFTDRPIIRQAIKIVRRMFARQHR